MKINLTGVGKRYNKDWVFRNLTFQFNEQQKYAITGPNGSGKSTLLQIISGSVLFNEGKIEYCVNNGALPDDKIYKNCSFSAPYIYLIEEMSLLEFFSFHEKMKGWATGLTSGQIIRELGLEKAAHRQIRYYSSGMKQRVKLAQAICSNVSLVLLDEPLSNLDQAGIDLYNSLIENYCREKMVIISSNDQKEYHFCDAELDISIFKQ